MDIVVAPDAQAAAHEAASWVARQLRNAVTRRGAATVAFSGGSTPALMLAELAVHAGAVGRDDRLPGRRASRARRRPGSQCRLARCRSACRGATIHLMPVTGTRPRRGCRRVRRTAAGPPRRRAPRARRRRAHRVVAARRPGDRCRRLGGDLGRVQGQGADDADSSRRQRRSPPMVLANGVGEGGDRRAMDAARPRLPVEPGQSHRHARRCSTPRRQRGCRTRLASVCHDGHHDDTRLVGAAVAPRVRPTCGRCSPTIPQRARALSRARRRPGDRLLEELDRRRCRAPPAGGRRGSRRRSAARRRCSPASPST